MFGINKQSVVAALDANKDGQLSKADVIAAMEKAEAELKARQTNLFNVVVIAGLAILVGGFAALQIFCRCSH